MDPVGAVVSVAVDVFRASLRSRFATLVLFLVSGLAWVVIAAYLQHTDVLSLCRVLLDWTGLPSPSVLVEAGGWLGEPKHAGVAEVAALLAGVLAGLSGRGSVLGDGRGGLVGWAVLFLACLGLPATHVVHAGLKGALLLLAFMWVLAWTTKLPSRRPDDDDARQLLGPKGVVLRWGLGMFETVMLPAVPLIMATGLVYEAFSDPPVREVRRQLEEWRSTQPGGSTSPERRRDVTDRRSSTHP